MSSSIKKRWVRSFAVLGVLVILFAVFANRLRAQKQESLPIEPGDQLHVQVLDTPDLEEVARVTDTGNLPLILGGSVKVAGMTPQQAAAAIESVLLNGRYLLHPRVLVTVAEYATQKVSVLGEVKQPGVYPIYTPMSVLNVLSLAGGLTDMAERRILIERYRTGEKIQYFVSNQPDIAVDNAVKVNPGDTILVPKAGIVYILGDVGRPGGYVMANNESKISVLELLAHAGGTNHSAVPSHAKLIRKDVNGYVEIPLQLSAMQKGKRADMQLQPDDIVYVPFSYLRNFGMQASGIASSVGSAAVYRF